MLKNAIRKTKLTEQDKEEFVEILRAWRPFLIWLQEQSQEQKVLKCLAFEATNESRPAFLDRLRTRFNTLRIQRELSELEKETGKIISLNFKK